MVSKVLGIMGVFFFLWPVSRAQVNRGPSDRQVPLIGFSKGEDDELIDGALVVNTSRNLNLTCNGWIHPVEWVVEQDHSFGDRLLDKLMNVSESTTAWLMGTSLGRSYTGRYICRYSEAKHINSSIYVYISDPKHAFVHEAMQNPIIFPVYQNRPFLLPCRTTRPDISVDFKKNGLPVAKEKYKFDPEQGIVVGNAEQYFSGFFTCSVQSQTINFFLQYLADPGMITITSLLPSSYMVLVGESFNITCKTSVATSSGLSMRWNYPDTKRSKGIMIVQAYRVPESQSRDEIISEFHLNDTHLIDGGTYRCTLELSSGQSTFKDVNITVIDKTFVFLTPERTLYEVEEGMEGVIVVTFFSYPVPQFEWYKDGNLISKNPRVFEDHVVFYFIKFTRNMAGVYTLHAYTRDQNATTDITLLIKYDCPDGFVLQNKSKGYECEACPEGYYSGINQTKCHSCPENSKTNGSARKSIDDCLCLPGFYATKIDTYTNEKYNINKNQEDITVVCERVRENAESSRSNEASNIIDNFFLLSSLTFIWLLNFVSFTGHSPEEFIGWWIVCYPSIR